MLNLSLEATGPARRTARLVRQLRVGLADGAATTVHVAEHPLACADVRVSMVRGQRLAAHCRARGIDDAIVGGFFTRPLGEPLGEVRTSGVVRRHVPFDASWSAVRACVIARAGEVRIARRDELPAAPRGDLLQAGPLLTRDGATAFERAADTEGFRAGAHQFDSDITDGRHPRAALGIGDGRLLAVVCDGRAPADAGLTLDEFAGGHGRARRPRRAEPRRRRLGHADRWRAAAQPPARFGRLSEPGGRGIATALVFLPRR